MESEDPATIIGVVSGVASAASGIASAFNKPSAPKPPPAVVNPAAQAGAKMRTAAAFGRGQTQLTTQKLGTVGID